MILVRLNDEYVAPIYKRKENSVLEINEVRCTDISCNHIGTCVKCSKCRFWNSCSLVGYRGFHRLEDVEVKFKFIEEEN